MSRLVPAFGSERHALDQGACISPERPLHEIDTAKFAFRDSSSGIRVDDTILPGGAADEPFQLGLRLRPSGTEAGQLSREIETLLNPVTFHYRIATEVGRSEERTIELRDGFDPQALAAAIEPRLE